MLSLFTACACPTFEDLVVVAADPNVTEAQLSTIEAVVEQFAEWTGEEGVCVERVEAYRDLVESPEMADYEVGGMYQHGSTWIRLDADVPVADLENITRHELCHALDNRHDYASSGAEVWPEVECPDSYDAASRVREAFAQSCDSAPVDTSLDAALWHLCALEPESSEAQRLIAEVVYPEAPRLLPDPAPVTLGVTEHTWAPVAPGGTVYDVMGVEGSLVALLTEPPGEDGLTRLVIRSFDDELQATADVVVAEGVERGGGYLIEADAGVYACVNWGAGWWIVGIEADSVTTAWPWLDWFEPWPAAVSQGVLYFSVPFDHNLWRMPAGGGEPAVVEGGRRYDLLWPLPGGIGFVDADGFGTFDGEVVTTGPGTSVTSRLPLGEGRTAFLQFERGFRFLLEENGVFQLAGDPCDEPVPGWWYTGLPEEGARTRAFPRGTEGAIDSDGDGEPEFPYWELTFGEDAGR